MTTEDHNQEDSMITLKSSGTSVSVSREALEPTPQAPLSGGMAPQGQTVQPLANPREHFLVRNRWLVLGVAVLLAIAVVGTAVYLLRDQSVQNAGKILHDNSAPVNTMASNLLSVYTVKSLRDKVGQAESRMAEIKDARAALPDEVSSDQKQLLEDADGLLKANTQYLRAITKFGAVKKLGDSRYDAALRSLKIAKAEILAKGKRLEKYEFPPDYKVVPDVELLNKAEKHLSEL